MPIFKWYKLHQTRDVVFLLSKPREITEEVKEFLSKIWIQLSEEFINRFGFSKSYLNVLEKKRQRAILELNIIISGDRSHQTFIDILTEEINDLEGRNTGAGDIFETKTFLEKHMGFRIDINICSVSEFQYYIKTATEK